MPGNTNDKKTRLRDRDIREPLFEYLEETFGRIRILEEKVTGRARADVVMVTPSLLYGIEIKSDADSYTRLAGQVPNYDACYDRNIIVAGTRHAMHVEEHVPDYWGIITVETDEEGTVDFYMLRRPSVNPKCRDAQKIRILWRTELNRLLAMFLLPKYTQKSKLYVQKALLENVPSDRLWPAACDELFERDYTTIDKEISAFRESRQSGSTLHRGRSANASGGRLRKKRRASARRKS